MIMMMFVSAEKNRDFTSDIRSDFSLDDLNFDPAALIGDNNGDWSVSPFKNVFLATASNPRNCTDYFSDPVSVT